MFLIGLSGHIFHQGLVMGALWELSGSSLGALWELVRVAGIF
jgi:hypothetical protein